MEERWFALLCSACKNMPRVRAAELLGCSAPTVSQVLNGSGLYGTGVASTQRLADRVLHVFGSYECPHLSSEHSEARVITADQCRAFAHRPAPISSPRDLAHWQACQGCPHRELSAPPQPRAVVPRKHAQGTQAIQPQEETP